jgi:DNA helicase IV
VSTRTSTRRGEPVGGIAASIPPGTVVRMHHRHDHVNDAVEQPVTGDVAATSAAEFPAEQQHLDRAYAVLDDKLDAARRHLGNAASVRTSHAQSRLESEAMQQQFLSRVGALTAAERRLCFGRIDLATGGEQYVGRIGLADADQNILQIDWRAPAAAPYYQASPRDPHGVVRRRHLSAEGRRVVAVHDDVFDFDAVDSATIAGDSVLLAALNRARTGKMGDIVETIQAEQDVIIRSDAAGVLVVEGGPGTGKTVVALHRCAHLLYRDRVNLERRGVLVVGPSSRFLEYIDNVLPALGETGVVLATIPDLYPGVTVTVTDPDEVAALKGDLRFAAFLADAVADIRRVLETPITLQFNRERATLTPGQIQSAARRALALDPQHNVARPRFLKQLMRKLASQVAEARGVDVTDPLEIDEILQEIRESVDARRALNLLWMPKRPEQLLRALYTDPVRRSRAARGRFTDAELELLARDGDGWSAYDVPLLDELAELLGPVDAATATSATHDAELDAARAAAYGTGVDAAAILERYHHTSSDDSVAERALRDREWAYGHAVVDEAQELSPMAWRMLARRVPSKSMTVVGDIDQASSPGAAGSWSAALDPIAAGRWRAVALTVNYRTPAAIVELARRFMAANGRTVTATAVREGAPIVVDPVADLAAAVRSRVSGLVGSGLTAVIAPAALCAALADCGAAVYTADQSKGLEFDNVVLVEPAVVLAETSTASLYVAITRPTQQLHVIHAGELPAGF